MMPNYSLANTLSLAHFHYIDGYVCLESWEQQHAEAIHGALGEMGWSTPFGRDVRAVVAHETAHLLDMTTTLWGMEFLHRKHRFHAAIRAGKVDEIDRSLSVLMLSYSEIATHQAMYVPRVGTRLSPRLIYKHGLEHNQMFGALIRVLYLDGDEVVVDAPLSILSILEASAYASEIVQRLADLSHIADGAARMTEIALYESEVKASLCDPNYIEYTLLLRLTREHFDWLSVLHLAHFVAALSRFALDISSLPFAIISVAIGQTFRERRVGALITHDMRRSSSRAVLAFKTMLLMYEWLHELPEGDERSNREARIRDFPREAIDEFWQEKSDQYGMKCEWDEFELSLATHPDSEGLHDEAVLRLTAMANRRVLAGLAPGVIPLQSLLLPDMLLGDNTIINLPNRIDVDVLGSLEKNHEALGKMFTRIHGAAPRKFY